MIRQGTHIIAGSPSPNINEKKAIELTKSAYEQLVADGLVKEDQNYIIIDDEAPNIIDDTLSSYDNVYSAAHTLGLINTLKENVYTKAETESAINRKLISAIKYKGKVAEAENLPSLAENGDAYYVTGESLLYIYNEDLANYEALGDIADLSAYLTEEEILDLLKEKNIKFQYAVMPEASSDFDYPIQYIGATNENYKLGSWYRSNNNSGTYVWEELLIEGKSKDPFETDTIPETAENGTTHLYIGTDNANYKKGHVYQYNDSSWNDITAGTIQLKTLPTANENELNKIYQYIGISNSNYTNGYFYECVESNGSYAWVEKEVQKNDDVPHWTGTHAEYEAQKDTIPAYAILHFTDDYDENVKVGIYSTEETKTGEIWIDNKPIYQKVLTGNMPNVSGSAPAYTCTATLTTYGALNIDTVVEVTGGVYYGKESASTPLNKLGFLPMGRIHVLNSGTGSNCNDQTFWYTASSNVPANRALVLYTAGSQVKALYRYNPPYIAVVKYTKTTD